MAAPSGTLIRRYPTGLTLTSNVAFGGPGRTSLFVTGAGKPGFFSEGRPFLELDESTEEGRVVGEAT